MARVKVSGAWRAMSSRDRVLSLLGTLGGVTWVVIAVVAEIRGVDVECSGRGCAIAALPAFLGFQPQNVRSVPWQIVGAVTHVGFMLALASVFALGFSRRLRTAVFARSIARARAAQEQVLTRIDATPVGSPAHRLSALLHHLQGESFPAGDPAATRTGFTGRAHADRTEVRLTLADPRGRDRYQVVLLCFGLDGRFLPDPRTTGWVTSSGQYIPFSKDERRLFRQGLWIQPFDPTPLAVEAAQGMARRRLRGRIVAAAIVVPVVAVLAGVIVAVMTSDTSNPPLVEGLPTIEDPSLEDGLCTFYASPPYTEDDWEIYDPGIDDSPAACRRATYVAGRGTAADPYVIADRDMWLALDEAQRDNLVRLWK